MRNCTKPYKKSLYIITRLGGGGGGRGGGGASTSLRTIALYTIKHH